MRVKLTTPVGIDWHAYRGRGEVKKWERVARQVFVVFSVSVSLVPETALSVRQFKGNAGGGLDQDSEG
jgi:hypothetical protein